MRSIAPEPVPDDDHEPRVVPAGRGGDIAQHVHEVRRRPALPALPHRRDHRGVEPSVAGDVDLRLREAPVLLGERVVDGAEQERLRPWPARRRRWRCRRSGRRPCGRGRSAARGDVATGGPRRGGDGRHLRANAGRGRGAGRGVAATAPGEHHRQDHAADSGRRDDRCEHGFSHGVGGYPCPAMATPLEEQLKRLPAKPGVYLFRDERGQVLYIGKAKSLRPRVRSYFQATPDSRSTIQRLPERVADVEVIVTDTEVEALHLEQNLVKRHRPPFNVRLRDDKSFPYIAVTVEDDYPRVMFTRERHRRGVVYFGPYANAKKVRETLDVLNRVFPYRPCEGPKPGRHSGIPCLDYHIERCLAPCVGYITQEDYREIIERVIEFLSGETRPIQRELERKMKEAAEGERFEEAARYRNRLFAVRHLVERQTADRRSVGSVDVIGLAVEGERAAVQIFPLRDGRLIDRYGFHLENVDGQDTATLLEAFAIEYYGSAPSVPPQIVVPRESGDTSALAEFLSERRGARVEVRAAERGEKKRLQELAAQNAQLALDSETYVSETKRARRFEALEELREALNLESLPIRIECFDISNIQGQEVVGSMVVFEDAVAKKGHYRKFTLRGVEGQDDFASMREVITRRFTRLSADPASAE